jgi:hypothetical protein
MSYGGHDLSVKVSSANCLVALGLNDERYRCKAFSAHLATSLDFFRTGCDAWGCRSDGDKEGVCGRA